MLKLGKLVFTKLVSRWFCPCTYLIIGAGIEQEIAWKIFFVLTLLIISLIKPPKYWSCLKAKTAAKDANTHRCDKTQWPWQLWVVLIAILHKKTRYISKNTGITSYFLYKNLILHAVFFHEWKINLNSSYMDVSIREDMLVFFYIM